MSAPEFVRELIRRFDRNRDAYKSPDYNETRLRREFIDPFFEALGWDVANRLGYAEPYRDVVHEDSVKVGGATKAPDYSFRIGPLRRFFVETKRPFLDVKNNGDAAFQLRRYGWSAKLPISILTNFEGFAVYDCRIQPDPKDNASVARVLYFTFDQFEDRWDEIASRFSKQAVLEGAFDRYAESKRQKRGTAEVDDAFLGVIERWRDALARNIAQRNPNLNQRDLNYAVQQTIDRIIFLRICEDRGIEKHGRLQEIAATQGVYASLCDVFLHADDRYNSGLFHFREESDRPTAPDLLSLSLTLDDKPLKDIIWDLYFPGSPYEFSVLSPDILGQVYEQFLGKVIRLTPGHRAVVEEKPEIRKSGGIYYTPVYVVRYIVQAVLGQLLAGRAPSQISKVHILDPACGSGSFLIAAYQYLLDWYLAWYATNDPQSHAAKRTPSIYQSDRGDWKLTTHERKRILLQHIYGVDIDPQAVEVTKLSLLLTVLHGETEETLSRQLKMFARALPDLGGNIKCGNALIGPEFYAQQRLEQVSDDDRYRVNVFDWRKEFAAILRGGGFDAIIGNPPYRRELDHKELMDEIARTDFGRRFKSARMDLWYYFVHRGLEVLRPGGLLSFIVNSYWMAGTGAEKLIVALRDEAHVDEIVFLSKAKVFRDVSGQHLIIRISNHRSDSPTTIRIADAGADVSAEPYLTGQEPLRVFTKRHDDLFRNGKVDVTEPTGDVLTFVEKHPPLEVFGHVRQGIAENPPAVNKKTNEKYGNRWKVGEGVFVLNPREVAALSVNGNEQTLLRPYYDLRALGRYYVATEPSDWIIYSTRETIPDIHAHPTLEAHLRRFKPIMDARRETKNNVNKWWHLHWPRDEALWVQPKLVVLQMAERPSVAVVRKPAYTSFSTNVFVPFDGVTEALEYFAGVLNSRLLWRWFEHNAKRRGVGLEINGNVLRRAPIRRIDFQIAAERQLHSDIAERVREISQLTERVSRAANPGAIEVLRRHMGEIDRQLDSLVYQLYEVPHAERAQVDAHFSSGEAEAV